MGAALQGLLIVVMLTWFTLRLIKIVYSVQVTDANDAALQYAIGRTQ